jgi:archaellin
MYSYQPANGDVVLCRLTSSYGCVTTNDVASNSTTMSVAPVFVPEVEVVANPGTVVPEGTEVTFTTVVSNAGATPTYQWMINAIPVSGATQPVFKTANLRNGDSVTCRVTGTGACSKTTINSVNMTITPATGVGHVNLSGSDLRLYPNPNSGVFEVRGTVGVKTDVEAQLEVTNVLGQVVYRGAARTKGGELEARIELGGTMANGMYMLNVTVGESRQSFHFVVKQ